MFRSRDNQLTTRQQGNFHNNAATIWIFIKGLKNTHTLASHVYEKGSQTLADAISGVEKLQAAQQLTATLLPSSTVNVMSSEDDKCFKCQESGHMACHCPHMQCFDCNEYGHIAADCPRQNITIRHASPPQEASLSYKASY